jgi:hypothetical protein
MCEKVKPAAKQKIHNHLARNKNHKLNLCSTSSYPTTRPYRVYFSRKTFSGHKYQRTTVTGCVCLNVKFLDCTLSLRFHWRGGVGEERRKMYSLHARVL